MTGLTEILFIAILALDLFLAAASRLLHCIRLVALQGFLVGILPLAVWEWSSLPHGELAAAAIVNVGIKAFVLPGLLARTMRSAHVCRELEPLVGYPLSVLIALLIMGGTFFFCRGLELTAHSVSLLSVPVAFATVLIGLFLIVARRKAITQTIGFLVFENGITVFGSGMTLEYGLVVELGILLDVLVLVFIMGIAVFQISREFEHIDSDRLNKLGDWGSAAKSPPGKEADR